MPLKRREMMLLGNPKLALINCLTAGYLGDVIGVQDRPKHRIDAGDAIRQLMHACLPHDNAVGLDQLPDIVRIVPLGRSVCGSQQPQHLVNRVLGQKVRHSMESVAAAPLQMYFYKAC